MKHISKKMSSEEFDRYVLPRPYLSFRKKSMIYRCLVRGDRVVEVAKQNNIGRERVYQILNQGYATLCAFRKLDI